MRRLPAPESVTKPPPSSTTFAWVLTTFAVAAIVIVVAAGPQLKVMMPPWPTAFTTAAEVQLAAVPVPMTWLGCDVLTALAAVGMLACPDGLPHFAGLAAGGLLLADGDGSGLDEGDAEGLVIEVLG